jgi:hypothetical protein
MTNPIAAYLRHRDTVAAFQRKLGSNLDPDARLILAELARYGYHGRTTMQVSPQTGQVDPMAMALAEGRRDMLLRVLQLIGMPLADFDRIIQEEQDNHAAE